MRLSLRATQRVVMTPLLQQAIQLLQLSTLELEQVVRKELEENPLLEELPEENLGRTATSLAEHLEEQLRLATDDPRMVAIGEAIIGNLDEDGYLRAGVDEIAKGMGVTAEEVESTLRIVQAFDPTGVAARSVQECL